MILAQLTGKKNWQKDAFSCTGFAAMRVTVQIAVCVSIIFPAKSPVRHGQQPLVMRPDGAAALARPSQTIRIHDVDVPRAAADDAGLPPSGTHCTRPVTGPVRAAPAHVAPTLFEK
jgi:hypothetical protein